MPPTIDVPDRVRRNLPEATRQEIQQANQRLRNAPEELENRLSGPVRNIEKRLSDVDQSLGQEGIETQLEQVRNEREDFDLGDARVVADRFSDPDNTFTDPEAVEPAERAIDALESVSSEIDADTVETAFDNRFQTDDPVDAAQRENRAERQREQRQQQLREQAEEQRENGEPEQGFEAPGPEVRQATRSLREQVREDTGLERGEVRIQQTIGEDGTVQLEARAEDGATVTQPVQNTGGPEPDDLRPAEEIDSLLPDSAVSEQESRRQDQEAFQTLAESSFEETTAFIEGEDTSDTVGVTDTLTGGALRERAAREELEGTGLQPVASAVGSTATIQTQVTEAIDDSNLSDVIDPVADDFVDRTGETTDTPGPTAVNREFDLLQQPRGEERLERRQRERRSQATSGAASIVSDTPVVATQTLALTESVARNPSNLEDFAGRVGPGFQQSFVEPAEEDPTGFFLEEVGPEVVAAGVGAGVGAGAATVSSRASSVPETPASSTETVDAPIQTRTEAAPDEVDFDDTAFNEQTRGDTLGEVETQQGTEVVQLEAENSGQPDQRRPGQQASNRQQRQRAEQFFDSVDSQTSGLEVRQTGGQRLQETETVESTQDTQSVELRPSELRVLAQREEFSSLNLLNVRSSRRGSRVVVEVPESQGGTLVSAVQRFQDEFIDNQNLGSGVGSFVPDQESQTSTTIQVEDFVDNQETGEVVDLFETGSGNRDIESIGQNEPSNPDLQDVGSRTETQNEVFDAELPRFDLNQGIGVGLGLNAAATPGLAQSEDTVQTPRPDQRQSPFEDEDTDTSQDLGQELIQDTQTNPGLGPRQGNVFEPVDRSSRDQQRNTDTNRNRNRRRDIDLPDIDLGEDEDEEDGVFGLGREDEEGDGEFTTSLVGESFGVGVTDEEAEGDTLTGLEGRIR